MILQKVEVNDILTTNSYFYIDPKINGGFLIDPGAEAEKLLEIINQKQWDIEAILLTHGHFDHIGAVEKISKTLNIPYYAHENAKIYLSDPDFNCSSFFGNPIILKNATYVKDGERILSSKDASFGLNVIHTPGHTSDSIIYYDDENRLAFVGDTIFKGNVGATHFPGGDENALWKSIREKILTLPDEVRLYSGHSEVTTVGAEKGI